jgi:hypothetical protein
MLGSKNSKVNTLVQIIDQEISGAIDNINEGNMDDAKAKLEYVKKITIRLSGLNERVKKSVNRELKEFDDHIQKFSAS